MTWETSSQSRSFPLTPGYTKLLLESFQGTLDPDGPTEVHHSPDNKVTLRALHHSLALMLAARAE